jgi:hypothetical protein
VRGVVADLGAGLPQGSVLAQTAGQLRRDVAWLGYTPGTRAAYVHCLGAAPK